MNRVSVRSSGLPLHRLSVLLLLAMVVTGIALSACSASERTSSTQSPTVDDAVHTRVSDANSEGITDIDTYIRHPRTRDFREWETKVSSLADAEQSIGVAVVEPGNRRQRTLQGVYVLPPVYPDGTPLPKWERKATLDYGEFQVGVEPVESEAEADARVEAAHNPYAEAVGLARKVEVRGRMASVRQKGRSEIKFDSDGNVVAPGVTNAGSVVMWSVGRVVLTVSSGTLSADELLLVAMSVEYR